ncbi:hypothetical protein VE02_04980 [Pseudogymnoascus sp. 03VT05]|nr:hypothetical protein VE02_04980 [Pseudogymnoascus sp. 03VT05]
MRSNVMLATRTCMRQVQRSRTLPAQLALSSRRWMSSGDDRKWSTPLAKQLSEAITATGPVPLASFMRMCLTADLGGYYMSKQEGRDPFGQKGDFVTSPEISQVFGELIGIWFVAEWMAQGKKGAGVELVEIGPGRGTLMDDMLRTIQNFKPMVSAIEAVYMVEASPALRETQREVLCGDNPMEDHEIGFRSISKYANIPIIWTENIRFVPSSPSKSPFIIAHEFFDALPIHAFQSVAPSVVPQTKIETPTGVHDLAPEVAKSSAAKEPQWRELVVSPAPPNSTHEDLGTPKSERDLYPPPEFELTLSKASTPHSLYLPEISDRYKALRKSPDSLIEISPESHAYMEQIAKRIGGSAAEPKAEPSGAALILDYGPADTIPVNSLRGIKGHQRVSPLSSPGLVDLSADVDFMALAETALKGSLGVEVYGPVEQGFFLLGMGIKERAEMLLEGNNLDEGKKQRIDGAWKRLIDRGPSGMGKVYKAMAVVPETGGKRPPVGFGGGISP